MKSTKITLCLECQIPPVLLVLNTPKGEMYALGCEKCKYFTTESYSEMGARVEWHRSNAMGLPQVNIALRHERMKLIQTGKVSISVLRKVEYITDS